MLLGTKKKMEDIDFFRDSTFMKSKFADRLY